MASFQLLLPILLFALAALGLSVGLLGLASVFGPSRQGKVKEMPYESGMDPIHDAHRKFDVRFHLVAIAFLVFDVELLFLYPWAVASRNPEGINAAVSEAALLGTQLGHPIGFSRGNSCKARLRACRSAVSNSAPEMVPSA